MILNRIALEICLARAPRKYSNCLSGARMFFRIECTAVLRAPRNCETCCETASMISPPRPNFGGAVSSSSNKRPKAAQTHRKAPQSALSARIHSVCSTHKKTKSTDVVPVPALSSIVDKTVASGTTFRDRLSTSCPRTDDPTCVP